MQRSASVPSDHSLPLFSTNPREGLVFHDQVLSRLFEAQVERQPDVIAVHNGEEQTSYQQLNEQANQLARYLRQRGIGPEARVGVYMGRASGTVIGLLGILKAGGVYVPLDPGYPTERLTFMLEDACIDLLLTQEHWLAALSTCKTTKICLDTGWQHIAQQDTGNLPPGTTGENLAYIIYTSGSTGLPKGVCCNHRGVLYLLRDCQRLQPILSGHGCSLWTSFNFDVSVYELFSALLAGGTLSLVPDDIRLDGARFFKWIQTLNIYSAYIPPFLLADLHVWLQKENNTWPVRRLLVGVEPISEHLLRDINTHAPALCIINGYGPTETTICSTLYPLMPHYPVHKNAPIGQAVDGTQLYLLTPQLTLVPDGDVGELYIGGEGLARGYLNYPALTAERFIPHPFSQDGGARLYKTGDLARYLPDGNLEFIGRADHQIKIRGIRVEPGEIEAALGRCPGVSEAIVVTRADQSGEKRLIAYLIEEANTEQVERPTEEELRLQLATRIPEYMVPTVFVWLDAWPLMPNGKLDRQALPAPSEVVMENQQMPLTAVEEVLAKLWTEVLCVKQPGQQADFFALGGHSLLATQLLSRVRQRFQLDLPLRSLFEAPTLAKQAQLIEQKLQDHLPDQRPLVRPVPRTKAMPLAYEQEQLWFLAQLEPASPVYNISLALRLEGPLQLSFLEDSLNALLERHESLRTCIQEHDGNPFQTIVPSVKLPFALLNLVSLETDPAAQQTAFAQARQQEADTPFNLEQAPLLRARLIRFNPQQHCLLLTFHHLIFDGWSQEVLLRELGVFYRSRQMNVPANLPLLPVQYVDYACWQREWLQGEVLTAELAHWQAELADASIYLNLPTDHPRSISSGFQGANWPFAWSAASTARLEAFAQQEGCTLYMLLLAGLEVVLGRYSRQDDFILGTPVSMRNQVASEGLIGMLVNTLVIRADVQGQPTGRALLRRVRERVLRMQEHAGLPLEKLVQVLQPERQGSVTPLVQVVLAWEETLPTPSELVSGLWIYPEHWTSRTAKFELTIFIWQGQQGLAGHIEYNTMLYKATTIQRLIGHWQQIVEGLLTSAEQPIGLLPMLTESEWDWQLKQWKRPARTPTHWVEVHRLVEAQVALSPLACAVRDEEQVVTYQQLDERANRLAHYLQSQGVGPDIRVGVCLERSVTLIVSLLAILKAGGAYVPLDMAYPLERLTYMLNDTQARLVLTQGSLLARLPQIGIPLLCLETIEEQLNQQPDTRVLSEVGPLHLAYVMYTSGSTGQPKGVAVTHQNITSLVAQPDYVHVRNTDTLLHFASVAFDASTFEIWTSLVNGACLLLAPPHQLSLAELSQLLQQQKVSILWLTASLFHQMVELHLEGLRSVKQLLVGGEALSVPHVRQVLNALPTCQVINGYGPTENTTFSCCYAVQREEPLDPSVPIGKPIARTQAYVLDEQLQPVPIGMVGELYLGGEGLARGYLNRPDLTAERFIPHPFSPLPGARLYRTGDLVGWQEDGTLLFVGRGDKQIKLRGYRIEPGEIENCLLEHSAICSAVVVLREERPGDKRLVAYLTGQESIPQIAEPELRQHLMTRVPEYMLPAAFVWLDTLPLMPNGKLDQRALPSPDWERTEDLQQIPLTPLEEVLAELWIEVLGVKQVSQQANFFALGGHSLLATRLISRVCVRFQLNLPLRVLFEAPTLADFAKALLDHETTPGRTEAIARLSIAVRAMSLEELETQLKAKKGRA